MPRSARQKEKLLILLDLLQRESDEEHPISVPALLEALAQEGIAAERKSVYDDIDTLRARGYDIVLERGRGYYLASRSFELPELKLLVDAVQSSKFISQGKSRVLIGKLEGLCSVHQAGALQRQVYVSGRVKTMNETVLYTIDAIYDAIAQDRQITFRYFDYNVRKEKVFRHNNKRYQVSPAGLLRSDECYYLVALEGEQVRNYRVDRMASTALSEEPRVPEAAQQDMAAYTRRHFGMFSGQERTVRLRCPNYLVRVMLDQFGPDILLIPDGADHFTLSAPVAVSPQFYGWLFGLGPEVELLSPADARQEYAQLLQQTWQHHAENADHAGQHS
jgi:predicted DNA-binding transcriptional regulator YafY